VFSTAADGQTSVDVHVLQGEREMAADNRTLGNFQLGGIAPAPRGVPQIEVTFDIDANGILNVSAKDRATGKAQAITITASSGLAKDEVEKLVKEAAAHSAEDQKKRALVDQRNQADNIAYQVEKLVKENREKLSDAEASELEQAVAETRKVAQGDDVAAIKSAVESLTQKSHKLAEQLYKKAEAPKPPADGQAGTGQGAPQGDVVDAEYTVKGN
jgi:molecular chaperone DnaK